VQAVERGRLRRRPGWLARFGRASRMTTANQRCRRVIPLNQGAIYSVSWSPDGSRIAFGDSNGGVGVVTAEGTVLWRSGAHQKYVYRVAWSPDGGRIASASPDGTVRVWDAASGSELLFFSEEGSGRDREVVCVCWSPDSRRIAWGRWGSP